MTMADSSGNQGSNSDIICTFPVTLHYVIIDRLQSMGIHYRCICKLSLVSKWFQYSTVPIRMILYAAYSREQLVVRESMRNNTNGLILATINLLGFYASYGMLNRMIAVEGRSKDPHLSNLSDSSPLSCAIHSKNTAVILYLLEGRTKFSITPPVDGCFLHALAESDDIGIAKLVHSKLSNYIWSKYMTITKRIYNTNFTPIQWARYRGNLKMVKFFNESSGNTWKAMKDLCTLGMI